MLRTPPDILITTPESLYLLLTSRGRELLKTVETVILDEVHAVAGTKRGTHLALSLEQLERVVGAAPSSAIGLSATQRPLSGIGSLGRGCRPSEIALVDADRRESSTSRSSSRGRGHARAQRPPAELSQPVMPDGVEMDVRPTRQTTPKSIWPSIYPALFELRACAPVDDRVREQPSARRAARAPHQRACGGGRRGRRSQ